MAVDTETLYPFSGVDTQRITEAGFEIPRQNGDSATLTFNEVSQEWKFSRGSLKLNTKPSEGNDTSQVLLRNPNTGEVEQISSDELVDVGLDVVGGDNIDTSYNSSLDEYTIDLEDEIDVDLLSIRSNSYSGGYEFTENTLNDELVLTGPTGAELMRQPVNGPTKFVQGLDLAFPIESVSDAKVTFVDANITSNSTVEEEVGYTFDVDDESILEVVGISDGDKIQDKLFRVFGSIRQSSGSLVTVNDNGEISYSLNQKTDGSVAKVLKIDSQGSSSKPTVPDEGTWHFEGNVTARVVSANSSLSDAEKGDSHVWRIEGVVSQTVDNPSLGSTNARFIGTPSVTTVANDVSVNNYSVDVFISSDGKLEVEVQGKTGDEVHWVGNLEVDEIVG